MRPGPIGQSNHGAFRLATLLPVMRTHWRMAAAVALPITSERKETTLHHPPLLNAPERQDQQPAHLGWYANAQEPSIAWPACCRSLFARSTVPRQHPPLHAENDRS